jgi:hypothetical protein
VGVDPDGGPAGGKTVHGHPGGPAQPQPADGVAGGVDTGDPQALLADRGHPEQPVRRGSDPGDRPIRAGAGDQHPVAPVALRPDHGHRRAHVAAQHQAVGGRFGGGHAVQPDPVGAVELEPDAVAQQRGPHQGPGAGRPERQAGPAARIAGPRPEIGEGRVGGLDAAPGRHRDVRPARTGRQRAPGSRVQRGDGGPAQHEPAAAGGDRGRIGCLRAADQPHRGQVGTQGERDARSEQHRRRQVGAAAGDAQPAVRQRSVQRTQGRRAAEAWDPPGQPTVGDQVDGPGAHDDQPVWLAVAEPGRPSPLAGGREPRRPGRGGRLRPGLALGGLLQPLPLRRLLLRCLVPRLVGDVAVRRLGRRERARSRGRPGRRGERRVHGEQQGGGRHQRGTDEQSTAPPSYRRSSTHSRAPVQLPIDGPFGPLSRREETPAGVAL